MDFQDKYVVVMVCGVVDFSVDKYTDDRVTIGPPFVIRREIIPMSFQYRKEMTEAHDKIAEKFREASKGQIPKGAPVGVAKWYETLLIPKGANLAGIRRLTEVTQYGGKILSQEGYIGASGISAQ